MAPAREVKLLADYRPQLVQQRTKVTNRLLWFLHELDPELGVPARGLKRTWVLDALELALSEHAGTVADIATDLLDDCRRLTARINELDRKLRDLVRELAPGLLGIPGCGVLSAAAILGETAGVPPVSGPRTPSPASTAPPQSRSGRPTRSASASTGAATAASTTPST
ncbi:hypothetical protein ACWGJX_45180 [Streptomyces sp. NPDC054775]